MESNYVFTVKKIGSRNTTKLDIGALQKFIPSISKRVVLMPSFTQMTVKKEDGLYLIRREEVQ